MIKLRQLLRKPIVLVGMMGSGKSTVGKRLAYKLNLQFYDSDSIIEERDGLSVLDIHEFRGEDYFKAKEREIIEEVLKYGVIILSTGGNSFLNDGAREMILEKSTSVWLKTDSKTILERVSRRNTRPNLSSSTELKEIDDLLIKWEPIYSRADVVVDCSDMDAHHVVDTILVKLKSYLETTKVV